MVEKPDTSRSLDDTLGAIDALFAATGPLAAIKDGYAPREEQIRLAKETARAVHGADTLLGDCPTGTGKGLGYLAGGVLAGGKLVVSTATLALQAQLLNQDLPLLKKAVCKLYGYPQDEGFSYAVMKGRSNYLCINRYESTLMQPGMLDGNTLQDLIDFRESTQTGDREDLQKPVPAGRWLEVASDGEDCAPNACSFREQCFYYAHRDKAASADVIAVNHALLLANAASYGNIFDIEGRHLVADEAHRLEEVMGEAVGLKVSAWRVKYAMRQAYKKNPDLKQHTDRAESAGDLFFDELRENSEFGSEEVAPNSYATLYDSLLSVEKLLRNDPREEAVNLSFMVMRLRTDLRAFYSSPLSSHAYAVIAGRTNSKDPTRKPPPELRSWLVETGEVFQEEVLKLFGDKGKVLVSATLAASRKKGDGGGTKGSFRYCRERLGLTEEDLEMALQSEVEEDGFPAAANPAGEVKELASPEIFDYARRCLIYTEPAKDKPSTDLETVRRAEELVGISGGNALILLSTSRAVRVFRENFETQYPVRYQGDDSLGRLVSWLRETEGAVLVGTRMFWEGCDVPKEALQMVVIDKVPFAPPDDPVIAALVEKAGKDWFRSVTLPRAQVALRQGAGRLMRTATDRGLIALLDPRINTRSWGKAVMNSLPDAPVTSDIDDVRRLSASYFAPTRSSNPRSLDGQDASRGGRD
ncbi:MAG: ATP-dependent DNA helicase [Rubrobacter sp.]|nr:ATP-dependent DNA helicase [Rubrobacter sp.]